MLNRLFLLPTRLLRSALLRKQYEVNVFGLVDVTSACLPYLRAQNEGTVIMMGSRSAWTAETIVNFKFLHGPTFR